MKKLFFLLPVLFISCEDVIDPDLRRTDPIWVVDAMINNQSGPQVITLTESVPYDDNENLPEGLAGAVITVTDGTGRVFTFTEDPDNSGTYIWTPIGKDSLGAPGQVFALEINYQGETIHATSTMGPVPAIDSITFEFDEETIFQDAGYTAEFWAKDFPGIGNTYWIKARKNGVLLNKPAELNIAFDAAFGPGSGADGLLFIPPIRRGINPIETDADNRALPGYQLGDSVYVEIHSISYETFNFLGEVLDNTNRPTGAASLFITPLTNVSTNLETTASRPVAGFFNVAAVSRLGKKLKD